VETARALARADAKVTITSRNLAAGEEVLASLRQDGIKARCPDHGTSCKDPTQLCKLSSYMQMFQAPLEVQQVDLADLSSVRSFAHKLQSEPKIDMMILNAGVAGTTQTYTKDNFELTVGTNHFGHFVLVVVLLDKLKQQVNAIHTC